MTTNLKRQGLFRRAVRAMIESREREAARYVNSALLKFDDETLASHGYDRAELKRTARMSALI